MYVFMYIGLAVGITYLISKISKITSSKNTCDFINVACNFQIYWFPSYISTGVIVFEAWNFANFFHNCYLSTGDLRSSLFLPLDLFFHVFPSSSSNQKVCINPLPYKIKGHFQAKMFLFVSEESIGNFINGKVWKNLGSKVCSILVSYFIWLNI